MFSPDSRQIDAIAIPETPANLAFGSDDLHTLFVTARTRLCAVCANIAGALPY